MFIGILSYSSCGDKIEITASDNVETISAIETRNNEYCDINDEVPYGENGFICGGIFDQQTISLTLDAYPNCTFNVYYSAEICQNQFTGAVYYYVGSYEVTDHDCQDFNDDVLNAQLNGTLEDFMAQFDADVYEKVRDHIGETALNSFGNVVVTLKTASCAAYCFTRLTKSNFIALLYYKVPCGEGCCLVVSEYWEAQGQINSYTDVTQDGNTGSECSIDDVYNCGIGGEFASRCTFTCDNF